VMLQSDGVAELDASEQWRVCELCERVRATALGWIPKTVTVSNTDIIDENGILQ
jgi:hypothetical protein